MPKLTVLVTCYRRRQFLRTAVDSVLRQEAPDGGMEVVLVKDEQPGDRELDAELRREGVTVLTGDFPRVGQMIATGLAAATGDVVKFLDDDDWLLDPRTLAAAARAFDACAGTGPVLLRQGTSPRDGHGRPTAATWGDDPGATARTFLPWDNREGRDLPGRLVREHTLHRLSALSVRREALVPHLGIIDRVEGATDTVVGALALAHAEATGGSLRVEPAPYVAYRVHDSSCHRVGINGKVRQHPSDMPKALRAYDALGPALAPESCAARYVGLVRLATAAHAYRLGTALRPSVPDLVRLGWSAWTRREPYVARDAVYAAFGVPA